MFIEIYYKFGEDDIVIRNMEQRVDIIRNQKRINRIDYMKPEEFEDLITMYNKLFGDWYRTVGEDLPEVVWCGK